jgi:hypothetical protein
MSKSVLRSLRTIVRVRERQQERLDEELKAQRNALVERQAEASEACAQRDDCIQQEHESRAQRDELFHGPFQPNQLIAMNHRIETYVANTAEAEKVLKKKELAVDRQQEMVVTAQREVRRNAQRIDSFKERIVKVLKDKEQADEDSAEEETEETSTARYCSRQRAAAKEAEYGANT